MPGSYRAAGSGAFSRGASMRRLGGGWLRLACISVLALMSAATSHAADGVWPPAVRYEAFLRAVELVSTEVAPEAAALDAAYRTYLDRAGELRVGCGRARDQLDRSMGLDATPEEVDRAWTALQQATARAAIAERELADRVVELVPGCRMSATAVALRFRVADAFSVGGEALTPFAALLQFRPPLDDRALVIAELERLLPAADRTLRAGSNSRSSGRRRINAIAPRTLRRMPIRSRNRPSDPPRGPRVGPSAE